MTTQNVRFKGLTKTTSEIESDKFAGRLGWNSTLGRFVMYYDATNYATMARRDVLETFALGIQDSTLTSGRIVYAGTGGRLTGDAGLTIIQTGGITRTQAVGNGTTSIAYIAADSADAGSVYFALRKAGVIRFTSMVDGSNVYRATSYDGTATKIDDPISYPLALGGLITIGGSAATKRDVNFTGNIQTGGSQRISNVGRFDASSIYNSAWAGSGIRPLLTDNVGMGYATDAATFRGTIGALGYKWKDAGDNRTASGSANSMHSLLGSTASRTFAANSIAAGDTIEVEVYCRFNNSNEISDLQIGTLFQTTDAGIAVDGTMSGSPTFTSCAESPRPYFPIGMVGTIKLKISLTCISTGSSGTFQYYSELLVQSSESDSAYIAKDKAWTFTGNTTVPLYLSIYQFGILGSFTGIKSSCIVTKTA